MIPEETTSAISGPKVCPEQPGKRSELQNRGCYFIWIGKRLLLTFQYSSVPLVIRRRNAARRCQSNCLQGSDSASVMPRGSVNQYPLGHVRQKTLVGEPQVSAAAGAEGISQSKHHLQQESLRKQQTENEVRTCLCIGQTYYLYIINNYDYFQLQR